MNWLSKNRDQLVLLERNTLAKQSSPIAPPKRNALADQKQRPLRLNTRAETTNWLENKWLTKNKLQLVPIRKDKCWLTKSGDFLLPLGNNVLAEI